MGTDEERAGLRSRGRRRLIAILLALLPFLGLEIGLRLIGFEYPPDERSIVIFNRAYDQNFLAENALHRSDPALLWSPRPGAPIPWAGDELVSPQGFRRADPDPAASRRVLALGDSSTFGFGVDEDQTYAALLEDGLGRALALQDEGRLQVLNGGIVGATVVQGLARYRLVRESWQPQVLIAAFGVTNEHWPAHAASDVEKLAQLATKKGVHVRVGKTLRLHLRILHLLAKLRAGDDGAESESVAGEGDADEDPALALARTLVPGYLRRVPEQDFRATLTTLLAEVRGDGAELVILRMPRRRRVEALYPGVVDFDPFLAELAERESVPFVDGHALFRARLADGATEEELFCDAFHPTPEGNALLATALEAAVAPLLAP